MKSLSLLFIAFILICTSCKKDATESGINFKLQYDGDPLVMFSDVTYPTGKTMQFQRISFFLSEMNLSKDNTVIYRQDVDYIDLSISHSNAEDAAEGYELAFDTDEELEYDQVSFNIGLTEEMNASVPEDYLSSSPLSRSSEYWRDWGTYIVIRLEGNIDNNEDGEYGAGESFTLHLGTDNVTRNFSQAVDSEGLVNVIIDVQNIFDNNGEIYDIENYPSVHALNDENIARMSELATNLQSSLSVE